MSTKSKQNNNNIERKILFEIPRIIKLKEIPLKDSIKCINGKADICTNSKKCNRKNDCNEMLKNFF
jgi:hypothetical protein